MSIQVKGYIDARLNADDIRAINVVLDAAQFDTSFSQQTLGQVAYLLQYFAELQSKIAPEGGSKNS